MMFEFSGGLAAPMGAHKMKLMALPALCEGMVQEKILPVGLLIWCQKA